MVSFGRKSKADTPSSEATLSSIPVPPADSALVIDLPEGQKLVLGKMEDGTVIEVATWRGTGRPDSRTNRLMLGVSSGISPTVSNDDQAPSESSQTVATRIRNVLLSATKRSADLIMSFAKDLWSRVRTKNISAVKGEKEQATPGVSTRQSHLEVGDFEFDKWLQSLDEDLPNAPISPTNAKGTKVIPSSASQNKKSKSGTRPKQKSQGKQQGRTKK
jgi:hypothetical protein